MKKIVATIVAVLLLMALAVPALANGWHMYVQEDNVKVYAEQDKNSKVVKTLDAGEKVTIEDVSRNQKWYGVVYEKKGKQRIGWIQSKYLGDNPPQSRCHHEFGKWETVTEPTCTRAGYRVRYCKKCGLMEESDIPKTGHTYGAWKVTKEATCTKPGERVRKCKVCGHEEKEEIIEPHSFGEWKVKKEATCTEEGERVRTCKVCGFEEKKAIEKTPHSYGSWEIEVEATDHSAGVRVRKCVDCGHAQREDFDPDGTLRRGDRGEAVRQVQQLLADQNYLNGGIDGIFGGGMEKSIRAFQKDQGLEVDGIAWPQTIKRLSHDFDPWQTIIVPTRFTDGVRVRICNDCGYEQRETVPAGKTIDRGSRGEDVRAVQQMLGMLGYDAGKFDGIYGKLLDTAFAAFAKDRGMEFEPGHLLPGDIDALMDAWVIEQDPASFKGEGDEDDLVNLALTVNMNDGEDIANDVCAFKWTLTNLGSEAVMYNALLLKYGEGDDSMGDVLVMDFDGVEMKPGAGNSASGAFNVASDWGEGDLHFVAAAISEKDGGKWLSNVVTFERGGAAASAGTVEPMPVDIDVNHLADGVYPAAFDPGDVLSGASGVFMNAVHIYTKDQYDAVDINLLASGDTIVVEGQAIEVETVEREDDIVIVNGGSDAGGCVLWIEDGSNVYVIVQDDDFATYTERGTTTLMLDTAAIYTDSADIERDPVTVDYPGICDALQASGSYGFDCYNTTLRIEDGKVIEIERVYNP